MSGDSTTPPLSAAQILARATAASAAEVSQAASASNNATRNVGQQLLLAQNPSQVRRILPPGLSAARSIALFHFGT